MARTRLGQYFGIAWSPNFSCDQPPGRQGRAEEGDVWQDVGTMDTTFYAHALSPARPVATSACSSVASPPRGLGTGAPHELGNLKVSCFLGDGTNFVRTWMPYLLRSRTYHQRPRDEYSSMLRVLKLIGSQRLPKSISPTVLTPTISRCGSERTSRL